jgi:hypothetical protein
MKALVNIGVGAFLLFAGLNQSIAQTSNNNSVKICPAQSVVLKANVPQNVDASGGFIWYKDGVALTSTASTSDSVVVTNVGNYSLVCVTGQGCYSVPSDAIEVQYKQISAMNDSFEIQVGLSNEIAITINDESGCDALDPTSIDIVTQATQGAVFANADGSMIFIPNPGFMGTDSFKYTVKDVANNTSNVATVYLTAAPSTPLSVKILNFEVAKKGATAAIIDWSIQKDDAAYNYAIERSVDGKAFEVIKHLDAAFENNVFRSSFLDEAPVSGRNFYRLKVADQAGTANYSAVKMVNFDLVKATEVFPNPSKGIFTVTTPGYIATQLQVVDIQGRVVYQAVPQSAATQIEISNLAAGTYFVKIVSASGKFETIKIQKH